MTFGIIVGAWLVRRYGWHGAWWGAGCLALSETIDLALGAPIGSSLARWTLEFLE